MFKKILVSIDSSETRTQNILQQAITLAKMSDAQLMLLHVLCSDDQDNPGLPMRTYSLYYPPVEDTAWETYQKRWEDYEQSWVEKLKKMSGATIAAGVPTEFTETAGEPGKQICNLAKNWQADVIIVGSRGRKGITEWLLGSVSNYVMHHAPCSVWVVHNASVDISSETAESAIAVQAKVP